MDLSETMKAALSKGPSAISSNCNSGNGSGNPVANNHVAHSVDGQHNNVQGVGYVTEKLYMLLQLYLQNKGWNPSVELLQCFSELKESAMLPSAAYLQILANRLTLDGQGRLILRDNGKIVLPFEHFANAVMLKHMSGPHGIHLSVEATVRAVVESYSIGRDNFGMEKEFIVEVVQSCPSPACRYYKNHLTMTPMGFMEQPYASVSPEFLQHLPPPHAVGGEVDLSKGHSSQKVPQSIAHLSKQNIQTQMNNHQHHQQQLQHHQQQHQITAAIIQQQNRVMVQQNLEKFSNLSAIEKQRVLQQLDKKQYEQNIPVVTGSVTMPTNSGPGNNMLQISNTSPHLPPPSTSISQHTEQNQKNIDVLRSNLECLESNKDLLALHNGAWGGQDFREGQMVGQEKIVRAFTELMKNMSRMKTYIRPSMCKPYGKQSESLQKINESSKTRFRMTKHILETAFEVYLYLTMQCVSCLQRKGSKSPGYIIKSYDHNFLRALINDDDASKRMNFYNHITKFLEISRYRSFGLWKYFDFFSLCCMITLLDTIQLVQTLRNCLPAPHIPVSSWKSEDRHRKDPETVRVEST